jgi:hypothetical protein
MASFRRCIVNHSSYIFVIIEVHNLQKLATGGAQHGVQLDVPDRALVRNITTRRIIASSTQAAGPARG